MCFQQTVAASPVNCRNKSYKKQKEGEEVNYRAPATSQKPQPDGGSRCDSFLVLVPRGGWIW
jgi:hypothetical protein